MVNSSTEFKSPGASSEVGDFKIQGHSVPSVLLMAYSVEWYFGENIVSMNVSLRINILTRTSFHMQEEYCTKKISDKEMSAQRGSIKMPAKHSIVTETSLSEQTVESRCGGK